MNTEDACTFVILGASGDLARKKIFPALFALDARGFLPKGCRFVGFARSEWNDACFRQTVGQSLKCEEIGAEACSVAAGDFLRRCHFVRGNYTSLEDARRLSARLRELEGSAPGANRIFYMALPPFVFSGACATLGAAGLQGADEPGQRGWTRVVMEKPFGRNGASSAALVAATRKVFSEKQIYRIDHYLGKEVVQDLLALRFANTLFEPAWNRRFIAHVHVLWKEDRDLGGRAGYFDSYGIIRDVMQNHLTQILALTAMEEPAGADADEIRDAKNALLRAVCPVSPDDLVTGQYSRGRSAGGAPQPGYLEEPGVPADSRVCTYAAAVLKIENERWRGVPFLISAGKGLDARMTEIRIHFKRRVGTLFDTQGRCPNALTIRVQPDEALTLSILNKVPGMGMRLENAALDLTYSKAFPGRIADAYENLLLDITRGDRSLFIREDELAAAWAIFDPVLAVLDQSSARPEPYPFGTPGPDGMRRLAARHGFDDCND